MIWLLLIYLLIMILDPAIDAIRKNRRFEVTIRHGIETAIVVLIYLMVGIGFLVCEWISGKELIAVGVLIFPVRWIIHDLVFNWVMGLPWDYLGTTAAIDIWLNDQIEHPLFIKLSLLAFLLIIDLIIIL